MSDTSREGGNTDGHDEAHPVGGHWRKSSFSLSNGDCVEVAGLADGYIGVRDSKAPQGPVLRFPPTAWTAFLEDIRSIQPTNQRD